MTALLLAVFGIVAGFWGGRQRSKKRLTESSFHAIYTVAALVWLGRGHSLVWLADRQIRGELRLESLGKSVAGFLQIFRAVGWPGR